MVKIFNMIRKATIKDIKQIHRLINYYATKDKMLSRSLIELYENLRDFFVYETNGKILGCCALHICWDDLAEVKSLAVEPAAQKKGIGSRLLKSALKEARKLKIGRIFALTYETLFFKKHGFSEVNKNLFPQKIWSECVTCAKFPDCDEIAMMKRL